MKTISNVSVSPQRTILNGDIISHESISGLYREFIGDYPKFYKMDALSKLGLVASDILLKNTTAEERENASIILFNRNGSLITDRNYQKTLAVDNYFPSPALFVYTLANIVTGEIAIRNKIFGESSFYILQDKNQEMMDRITADAFLTSSPTFIITGWVDYNNERDYLAELKLVTGQCEDLSY